jgi:hypothetical protein
MPGTTRIEIHGEDFWINDQPTYAGRYWNRWRIEGLLFNSRMVQATFDDLNPDTRERWAYPDTRVWDRIGIHVSSWRCCRSTVGTACLP